MVVPLGAFLGRPARVLWPSPRFGIAYSSKSTDTEIPCVRGCGWGNNFSPDLTMSEEAGVRTVPAYGLEALLRPRYTLGSTRTRGSAFS